MTRATRWISAKSRRDLGLGAAGDLRDGSAQDSCLVSGQYSVVGGHSQRALRGRAARTAECLGHGVMAGILLIGANGQVGWEIARQARIGGLACHALDRRQLDITMADAVLYAVDAFGTLRCDQCRRLYQCRQGRKRRGDRLRSQSGRRGPFGSSLCLGRHTAHPYFDRLRVRWQQEDALHEERSRLAARRLRRRASWPARRRSGNVARSMSSCERHGSTAFTGTTSSRPCCGLVASDDGLGLSMISLAIRPSPGDLANAILDVGREFAVGTWPNEGFGTFHLAGAGVNDVVRLCSRNFRNRRAEAGARTGDRGNHDG